MKSSGVVHFLAGLLTVCWIRSSKHSPAKMSHSHIHEENTNNPMTNDYESDFQKGPTD